LFENQNIFKNKDADSISGPCFWCGLYFWSSPCKSNFIGRLL